MLPSYLIQRTPRGSQRGSPLGTVTATYGVGCFPRPPLQRVDVILYSVFRFWPLLLEMFAFSAIERRPADLYFFGEYLTEAQVRTRFVGVQGCREPPFAKICRAQTALIFFSVSFLYERYVKTQTWNSSSTRKIRYSASAAEQDDETNTL